MKSAMAGRQFTPNSRKACVRTQRTGKARSNRDGEHHSQCPGFCVPVLIGKDNHILDGGARIQAARLLGLGYAPCLRSRPSDRR